MSFLLTYYDALLPLPRLYIFKVFLSSTSEEYRAFKGTSIFCQCQMNETIIISERILRRMVTVNKNKNNIKKVTFCNPLNTRL